MDALEPHADFSEMCWLAFVCHLPTQSRPSLANDGSTFGTFLSTAPEGTRSQPSTARRRLYRSEDSLLAALPGIRGVLIHGLGSGQATQRCHGKGYRNSFRSRLCG